MPETVGSNCLFLPILTCVLGLCRCLRQILLKRGVVLNVWERPKLCHAFRVKGDAGRIGVVSFDDFQRACVLTAIEKIKGQVRVIFNVCWVVVRGRRSVDPQKNSQTPRTP